MNRYLITLVLWIVVLGNMIVLPDVALSEDDAVQMRLAYFELTRIQLLNMLDVSYEEYREAVAHSREQIWLLRDDLSTRADLLRAAQDYYEQALVIWSFQADIEAPADIVVRDEPDELTLYQHCMDIHEVDLIGMDRVSVQNGVACLWHLSAAVLNGMASSFH